MTPPWPQTDVKVDTSRRQTVRILAFSPTNSFLVCGCNDGTIYTWKNKDGRRRTLRDGHDDEVSTVVFASDGTFFVSGSRDCTIRLRSMTLCCRPLRLSSMRTICRSFNLEILNDFNNACEVATLLAISIRSLKFKSHCRATRSSDCLP